MARRSASNPSTHMRLSTVYMMYDGSPRRGSCKDLLDRNGFVFVGNIADASTTPPWPAETGTRVGNLHAAFATWKCSKERHSLGGLLLSARLVAEMATAVIAEQQSAPHPARSLPESDVRTEAHDPALNHLPPDPVPHAEFRWASSAVAGVNAQSDPRTLAAWAHHIGASYGTLRNWCYAAQLPPRHSLWFMRVLRAVVLQSCQGSRRRSARSLLDTPDRRTLRRLLQLGNRELDGAHLPASVDEFLDKQQWIANSVAVRQVRALLNKN